MMFYKNRNQNADLSKIRVRVQTFKKDQKLLQRKMNTSEYVKSKMIIFRFVRYDHYAIRVVL